MSEQIREQISSFLDGELPSSETELLLKRLMRDAELRESFGRYALVGEALRAAARSADRSPLRRGFACGVNAAIDGETAATVVPPQRSRTPRWWRPVTGAAVAAGVAAVAVVALQQRAVTPSVRRALPSMTAQNAAASPESLSYTTPAAVPAAAAPAMLPAARLTSYVFAHSRYSSVLGQSNVLSGLLADADEQASPHAAVPPDVTVTRAVASRAGGDEAAAAAPRSEARVAP